MPSYLITNLIVLALFVLLGFFEARRLTSRHKEITLETLHHKAHYIYILVAVIFLVFLALGIPMMNRTLMWQAPFWFDLYGNYLKFGILIACFSFLFSLASVIAVLTGHKERKSILIASTLLIALFPILAHQYIDPVYPQLTHIKFTGKSDVIYQSSPTSCAAASGANIAHVLGIEKTEKYMARVMNTSKVIGTNAGQIIHGMAQVGITCSKKWVKGSDIEKLTAPSMIFIDNKEIGPESHAVAFMERDGDKVEIWDPLEGKVSFTRDQIQGFWKGKSLECSLETTQSI